MKMKKLQQRKTDKVGERQSVGKEIIENDKGTKK
jgi:hypothetical protein